MKPIFERRSFCLLKVPLRRKRNHVHYSLNMALCDSVMSMEFYVSYGTHLLDHLAADGAGFPGGQVAIIAVLQVDAHFLGSLHLELVHGFPGLGNVDLVVIIVAHIDSPFLSSEQNAFRRKHFLFRSHSLAQRAGGMPALLRQKEKIMEISSGFVKAPPSGDNPVLFPVETKASALRKRPQVGL